MNEYMDILDEFDRRRPDWIGGRPVRLSNGQDWLMPPVEFHWIGNRENPVGPWWGLKPAPDPGDDVMQLLYALGRCKGPGHDMLDRSFRLAATLLLKNYALDDDDLRELLPFHPERVALAAEQIREATSSMAEAGSVLEAFYSHINPGLFKFDPVTIASCYVMFGIDYDDVAHLVPKGPSA